MRRLHDFILQCGEPTHEGTQRCTWPAGFGTFHKGYGRCQTHSNRRAERAWQLAMDIARELDKSPWDALLFGVRVSAGAVMETERKLKEIERANDGAEITPPEIKYWRAESRRERTLMARISKAAIDAGVAERLVRQVELEGTMVAAAIAAALDAIELTPEQRMDALGAAQRHLFAIEAGTDGTGTQPPGQNSSGSQG
jgi:hypothetical protein